MKSAVVILVVAVAVKALPQAVTAVLTPTATRPSGCSPTYTGVFGLAVRNLTAATGAGISTIADGQPQAPTAVSVISDGQPQAPTARVSVIPDGQPQAPTGVVSVISDGQPQAPTGLVSVISDGQPQAPTARVSVIPDGQPQAPTGVVSVISDGQPQAPTGLVSVISDGQPQAPRQTVTMIPIGQIGDGQIQRHTTTVAVVTTISDGQVQATRTTSVVSILPDGQPSTGSVGSGAVMVGCNSTSSLQLRLSNGVLTDNLGRTGSIVANRQFQFDGPPQAGSIYTAGWSVCSNGSLALGGSAVFYQCLSGSFFNLYDQPIGGQCSPITLNAIRLVQC